MELAAREPTAEALPGRSEGAVVAARSLTDRLRIDKGVERRMAERRVAERRTAGRTEASYFALREADAFSYSVAHDLRAPLRAMKGYARILLEDYAAQLPADARAHLDTISIGAQRMEYLIEGLLALFHSCRQPLAMAPVNARQLVDQALDDLRCERSDRIRTTIGELHSCRGDATLLQQVWTNLLSNAFKFTRERDPALIEIGSSAKDGRVTYFVRDNGAGFDMNYAERLFHPFCRLHHAGEYEGTGIGLSIVCRIIKRHGGRLWAEARCGEGASFYFALPGV